MTTFYLKYRPQKISELDLEDIRKNLSAILSSGLRNIPHAFLFCGPKGLGKTSSARILAKAVNCIGKREKTDFEPCNKCDICLGITRGVSFDLIEIDAASNRGIDDIRELREKIKLAPSRCRKKVYVIDEVHMLTTEAFNALLKTLEEPPEHALFILCTTEAHKLPETIISRCLRLNFRKPTFKELVQPLNRIVKKENLKVENGVLEEIGKHADGSFRDAVKILEQLSFLGKTITLLKTREILGENEVSTRSLLTLLAARDKKALGLVSKIISRGGNLKFLSESILETLRQILLQKYGVITGVQDFGLNLSEVKLLLDLFDQASRLLKEAVIPALPLELAVASWLDSSSEDTEKPAAVELTKTSINLVTPDKKPLIDKWPEILQKVKGNNQSVEALLKSARPLSLNDNILSVEVFYPFHKNKLEEVASLKLVETKLKEIFDKPIKVKYKLRKPPLR